jgi:hypothetical protein
MAGEKIIGARNAWHSFGGDQALRILEHLSIGRVPACRFHLRGLAALILHLAAVEAHNAITAARSS